MSRSISGATLLIAGAALMAPMANAQTFSGSGCGGDTGGFLICGGWSGLISGNTVMLTINNTSNLPPANNPNSAWTTIGLGGITGTYTLSNTSSSTGTPAGWMFNTGIQPSFNGQGLVGPNIFDAQAPNGNPATTGLRPGGPYVFNFVFTQAITGSDFTNLQIAIFDQAGPGGDCGGSSKVVFNAHTGAVAAPGTTCAGPPVTTVPEPGSLALVGTGLVGLAPIFRRRRRTP